MRAQVHITLNNVYARSLAEMKAIVVAHIVPHVTRLPYGDGDSPIDVSIYANNKALRLPGSIKRTDAERRVLRPLDGAPLSERFIRRMLITACFAADARELPVLPAEREAPINADAPRATPIVAATVTAPLQHFIAVLAEEGLTEGTEPAITGRSKVSRADHRLLIQSTSRDCAIKGAAHEQVTIYYVVNVEHATLQQRCHADACKRRGTAWTPLPPRSLNALRAFASAAAPPIQPVTPVAPPPTLPAKHPRVGNAVWAIEAQ